MKGGAVAAKEACHHGYTTLSAAPRSVHHLLTNVRLECLPPNQGFGGETALAAAAAAAAAETSDGKSALVLGWFGAQDKELEFVKKIYKKKGFSDVVVHASPIASCSKPRGWYRSVASLSKATAGGGGADADADAVVRAAEISRPFDVVHVMSGGFLNLYLTLMAGVPLKFDTLVLDSTPILPKPASFTRFARAYMASMKDSPVALIPKLVPAWLHLAYVSSRWTVSSAYVGLKHVACSLLAKLGLGSSAAAGTRKLSSFAPTAVTMRYGPIVDHCIETIFGGQQSSQTKDGKPLHAIFVHNPEDPYINNDDLKATSARARDDYGCTVDEVEVPTDHVKANFRKPAAIFGKTAPPPAPAATEDTTPASFIDAPAAANAATTTAPATPAPTAAPVAPAAAKSTDS